MTPRSHDLAWEGRELQVTVPGCGHAPALNTAEQCMLGERFFRA